jgi:mannose-6-phosphate isomerase-like protein (cupin superfamily)
MPLIKGSTAPKFEIPCVAGVQFTGLAAPSRGSTENCVWRVSLAAHTPGAPHLLDREEVFAVISGRARATLGEETIELAAGDALVVPPNTSFSLANPHAELFEAIVVLPVGGRARVAMGEPFVPPWAS